MSRRLIDADALLNEHCEGCPADIRELCKTDPVCGSAMWLVEAPTIDAVELPCKIGDKVWVAKQYKTRSKVRCGTVSEMFYTDEMRLMIVVKCIARGHWGETIFATREEAQAALDRKGHDG